MKICKECHGGCCRRYNPDITGYDIIKIVETLDVDICFFLNAIPILEQEKINELRGKVPLFLFTDAGEPVYFRFCLKCNESAYFPNTTKCIFLQEWNAEQLGSEELKGVVSRCGIYSCRPLNCRAYPAVFNEDTKRARIRDPYLVLDKEQVSIEDSPAYKLCPRPLAKDDYKVFMDDLVKNSLQNQYEKEYFLRLSEKWNKNPGPSSEFYSFLVEEYGARIDHITG